MAMTLIDLFRGFMRNAQAEHIPPGERVVYFALLAQYNEVGRAEWFKVTDVQLSNLSGISTRSITSIKNKLKQRGWIDFKTAATRKPTAYRMTMPEGFTETTSVNASVNTSVKKGFTETISANTSANTSVNASANTSVNTSVNTSANASVLNRVENTREEKSSITPDLLTNSRELTQAEQQVKSAFESTFHPLTKLDELDALKAYAGEYGSKAVVRAIETASKRKTESWDRQRLSPRYLLPILQEGDEQRQKPATREETISPFWIPRKKTPEELEDEKKRLKWLKEQERKYGNA